MDLKIADWVLEEIYNLKLCYVDDCYAYFTTKELSEQWGDDWNDAPYEHNAGSPYSPHKNIKDDWNEDGSPKWRILRVAFNGALDAPCENHLNSPYSVEEINKGNIPWLKSASYYNEKIEIYAGETLKAFIQKIKNLVQMYSYQ